jgi:hypothetical protein
LEAKKRPKIIPKLKTGASGTFLAVVVIGGDQRWWWW